MRVLPILTSQRTEQRCSPSFKTAKALGLEVPLTLLARADERGPMGARF
jgi:hypothetical protein